MRQVFKVVLSLLILASIGLFFFLNKSGDEMESIIKDYDITFENLDKKLYSSARAWGLGGNHEEIVLSAMPIGREHKSYSNEKCFIFYTESLYYKIDDESNLIIYVDQSSVSEPSNFESEINVIIKGLKTAAELEKYHENYKTYGLKKVSIFD